MTTITGKPLTQQLLDLLVQAGLPVEQRNAVTGVHVDAFGVATATVVGDITFELVLE